MPNNKQRIEKPHTPESGRENPSTTAESLQNLRNAPWTPKMKLEMRDRIVNEHFPVINETETNLRDSAIDFQKAHANARLNLPPFYRAT